MRMTNEQYVKLTSSITATLSAHNIDPDRVNTKKDAWNVFAAANGYWLYSEGLNDKHIETALCRLFPAIRQS